MSKGRAKQKDKVSKATLDKGQTSLIDLFGRNRRFHKDAGAGCKDNKMAVSSDGTSNSSSAIFNGPDAKAARRTAPSEDDDVEIVEVLEKSTYFSGDHSFSKTENALKSFSSKLRRKSRSSKKSDQSQLEPGICLKASSDSEEDKLVVNVVHISENDGIFKTSPSTKLADIASPSTGNRNNTICTVNNAKGSMPPLTTSGHSVCGHHCDRDKTESAKRKNSDDELNCGSSRKRFRHSEPHSKNDTGKLDEKEASQVADMDSRHGDSFTNQTDYHFSNTNRQASSPVNIDASCDTKSQTVNTPNPSQPDFRNIPDDSSLPSSSQESFSQTSNVPGSEKDSDSLLLEESQEMNEKPQYTPYYIENFKLVIDTILNDEFFNYLFDKDDLRITDSFQNLSDQAQKLYVRLFLRKHKWLCPRKIHYPKIADDLEPHLTELVNSGFLLDERELEGLEMCLNLLPADELRGFAKKMHVDVTNQRMPAIIEALLRKSRQRTVGAMFGMRSNLEATMLKSVKLLVGQCYRLHDIPRLVFLRLMMLFSLTSTAFEDDEQVNSQQLFQILQVNRGLVKYPDYTIQRKIKIFRSKDDLVRFQMAVNLYSDILGAIENHAFEEGVAFYKQGRALYLEHCAEKKLLKYESSLPSFLQVYTPGSVYIRILNQGVEVLQKMRNYDEANEQLEELLGQSVHCTHYRGHWWDRLALNLDQHLKKAGKALDAIGKGLHDKAVRAGRRLALYQRACKICESPSNKKLKNRLREFQHATITEAPKVTIQGRLLPKSILGSQSHFVNPEGGEDVTLCRVEQVAIAHYKKEGYDQGIHGEGSTFSTLMMLYFWDIVFMQDIPDVFYNKYQTAPLDLNCEDFYANRKRPIQKRLKWLKSASVEDLLEHLRSTWLDHEGEICSKVNWERFDSLEQAKTLVTAFGGKFMSQVFKRILKDPRHTSSGMPDLVVWNTAENTFRLVEVKGPGDKLSTKQILWLDYFLSLGATAEVCHVVGVGAKRLHSLRESQDK